MARRRRSTIHHSPDVSQSIAWKASFRKRDFGKAFLSLTKRNGFTKCSNLRNLFQTSDCGSSNTESDKLFLSRACCRMPPYLWFFLCRRTCERVCFSVSRDALTRVGFAGTRRNMSGRCIRMLMSSDTLSQKHTRPRGSNDKFGACCPMRHYL